MERFPEEFMFQLNEEEFENWKSQIVISNSNLMSQFAASSFSKSQIVTLNMEHNHDVNLISQTVISSLYKRKKTSPPLAFTEHGAVMLASVLRSPSAIQMSVMVTRAFIAMRKTLSAMQSMDLKVEQLSHKVDQLNAHVEEILHDQNDINQLQSQFNNDLALQIEAINDALDQLREKKDEPSRPIGFKIPSE